MRAPPKALILSPGQRLSGPPGGDLDWGELRLGQKRNPFNYSVCVA